MKTQNIPTCHLQKFEAMRLARRAINAAKWPAHARLLYTTFAELTFPHDDFGWHLDARLWSVRQLCREAGLACGSGGQTWRNLVAAGWIAVIQFQSAKGPEMVYALTPSGRAPQSARRAHQSAPRADQSAPGRAHRSARRASQGAPTAALPISLSDNRPKDQTSSSSSSPTENIASDGPMMMMMTGTSVGKGRPKVSPERLAFVDYIRTTKGMAEFDNAEALQFSQLLTIEQLGWAMNRKLVKGADRPARALWALLRRIQDNNLNDGERDSLAIWSLRRDDTRAWLQYTREGNEFGRSLWPQMLEQERGDVERAQLAIIAAAKKAGGA